MPTAISAQVRANKMKIEAMTAHRYFMALNRYHANDISIPVPKIMAPPIRKSTRPQFTSEVNCIAISGTRSKVAVIEPTRRALFFNITMSLMNSNRNSSY